MEWGCVSVGDGVGLCFSGGWSGAVFQWRMEWGCVSVGGGVGLCFSGGWSGAVFQCGMEWGCVSVGDGLGLCFNGGWSLIYILYWSLLYSAILRSWADSLRSHVILHEWIAFYSAFLNIHRSGVLTALAWLVPQEPAARESQSRRVLCTPYNHAPCHFMQSHIRKVYACLALTCHLRFWQNDRGLLRATAVTRGWNGYRNKSQHRKLTLEKKILPPLQQGFEPANFRSRVRRSDHWAIPAPQPWGCVSVAGGALGLLPNGKTVEYGGGGGGGTQSPRDYRGDLFFCFVFAWLLQTL